MSLRQKLLQIKADREKWEDGLVIALAALLAASTLFNVGLFFSVRKTPSLPGAAASWLYAVLWLPGALLLRNRAQWVRAVRVVRWTAVWAILLGIAAGAAGGLGLFSALCVMPYALFTAPYGGLSQPAWVSYALPLAQAAAASLLARRLRRRRREEDGGL